MTSRRVFSAGEKQKHIEAAARATNPLEEIEHQNYTSSSGVQFNLYCKTKADMDAKTLKWTFKLAEQNVGPYYKQLKMGWQPKVKQNDLKKNWARFLVAVNQDKQPVAYAMFRFDLDYGNSVLYCYEMQIERDYQRLGLGKHMMYTLEACARKWLLEKIVLTVLNNNDNALSFFKSIGFSKDETSPDVLEEPEYQILSKQTLD